MKNILLVILLVLISMVTLLAHADPLCDRIFVSGLSYHLNRDEQHNEINYGVGCVHTINEDWRATLGTYHNSIYKQTVFISASYNAVNITDKLHFVVTGGAAIGYAYTVIPVIFPELRYDVSKKIDLSIAAIPPTSSVPGVIGLFGTISY